MIYLLQVLHLVQDLDLFELLFSDISDLIELGYTPEEACNDLLEQHFGLSLEDDKQLAMFTSAIQRKHILKSAINVVKIRKLHDLQT